MKTTLFAFAAVTTLAVGCGQASETPSLTRSLTGDDFAGTKHYLGWGAAAGGDPSMMHNEVKYDVLHTHDIFTNEVGGDYAGAKLIGTANVNRTAIRNEWTRIGQSMTANDMFVQYSSGHGYESGLGVGVSYDDIRNNALSYPAKEIVIFTMACHSGGLVDSFNRARDQWSNFEAQGRTLLVMGSSPTNQNSSTGPGTDPDQPSSPNGSAGSAFGHALWKSLIGYADGYIDGVKDGYLSLEEIIEYTKYKTRAVGGHTPVYTGTFNKDLVMTRVPPRAFLAQLEGSTEGLSDEQVAERVQALDAALRVQ